MCNVRFIENFVVVFVGLVTQVPPALSHRKAGKYTEDPIKNLPQLPEKRSKPQWSEPKNPAQFTVDANENPTAQHSLDLIERINASIIYDQSTNRTLVVVGHATSETQQLIYMSLLCVSAEDPKRYRLEEIRPKKPPVRSSGIQDDTNKKTEFIKKSREDFRRSLVDIIM